MSDPIKEYVKRRDEMLMKCSTEELRKFVKENADYFKPEFVELFSGAAEPVVEMTLHKMITGSVNLPRELRIKSHKWLKKRGCFSFMDDRYRFLRKVKR